MTQPSEGLIAVPRTGTRGGPQTRAKISQVATRMFLDNVEAGFKLAVGVTVSFVRQCEMWDSELFSLLRRLVATSRM